jgi:hypothetical protein
MRKPEGVTWTHTATYGINPEVDSHLVHGQLMDKDGEYVTGTLTGCVVTWYDPSGLEEMEDNDPSIQFFAKRVTKAGKVDQRFGPQRVFFSDREDRLICEALGIDLTCPVP